MWKPQSARFVYGLQPYMVKIGPVFLQYQLCTSVIATSEMIYHRGGEPEQAMHADLMSWHTSHG